MSASGLTSRAGEQLTLGIDENDGGAWDDANEAIDEIRRRFGPDAIVPASLTGPDGVRVARRGDQQWGPDDGRTTSRRELDQGHAVVGRSAYAERSNHACGCRAGSRRPKGL